jgi:ElaB/YqjD/DUF883 family membrane-anchored ribosome-binding protein
MRLEPNNLGGRGMAETAGTGPSYATSGSSESAGVKEQAQQKAQDVKDQAVAQAEEARGQARDRLREQVDQRSTQAGQRVGEQAQDLRAVGEQLREQGKEGPARLVDQVAQRTERAGSYLEQSDADRILEDVEDFARRNPWAVLAGSVGLGFVASRLLKASSSRRYQERAGREPAAPAPATTAPPAVDEPLAGPASTPVTASASPLEQSP